MRNRFDEDAGRKPDAQRVEGSDWVHRMVMERLLRMQGNCDERKHPDEQQRQQWRDRKRPDGQGPEPPGSAPHCYYCYYCCCCCDQTRRAELTEVRQESWKKSIPDWVKKTSAGTETGTMEASDSILAVDEKAGFELQTVVAQSRNRWVVGCCYWAMDCPVEVSLPSSYPIRVM